MATMASLVRQSGTRCRAKPASQLSPHRRSCVCGTVNAQVFSLDVASSERGIRSSSRRLLLASQFSCCSSVCFQQTRDISATQVCVSVRDFRVRRTQLPNQHLAVVRRLCSAPLCTFLPSVDMSVGLSFFRSALAPQTNLWRKVFFPATRTIDVVSGRKCLVTQRGQKTMGRSRVALSHTRKRAPSRNRARRIFGRRRKVSGVAQFLAASLTGRNVDWVEMG